MSIALESIVKKLESLAGAAEFELLKWGTELEKVYLDLYRNPQELQSWQMQNANLTAQVTDLQSKLDNATAEIADLQSKLPPAFQAAPTPAA